VLRCFRRDLCPCPESCGEDVSLRMSFGFLRADHAVLHQATDIRMIVSQTGNSLSSRQIQTAIADVCLIELVVKKNDRRGCSPHAVQFWMPGSVVQDAFVCDLKAGEKKRLHVRIGSFGENLFDGIDRDAAGLLSTFVPTHAVGHDRQPPLAGELLVGGRLPVSEMVFIVFALAANIAHAGQLNSRPYSHHTSHVFLEQTKNRSWVT